jgi:glycosyltransferase involved in cell wall biosynthesis
MKTLLIAICTCKRPVMLSACLQSVIKIQTPKSHTIKIAIIDNDNEKTTEPVVNEITEISPFEITLIHEPRRGIPIARNRALDFAKTTAADYLLFIDDDEEVTPEWLINICSYAKEKGENAIIHGRVISKCPPNAPKHLVPFFTQKKYKPTGMLLTSCATNNVLIPLAPIWKHQLRFDESRPLAGGTDTVFFYTAHEKGIQIFSCAESIVTENIPLNRVSLKWLSHRKFRAGIDVARRNSHKGESVIIRIITSVFELSLRMLTSGFFQILMQRQRAAKEWLKLCRSAGSLCGVFGLNVDSYRSIDDH